MQTQEPLEREHELARIAAALDGARAGRGSLLVLEGPAGIGKTTVLAAARASADAAGVRVLRARGAEREGEFAFGVVRQLVEPVLAEHDEAGRARLLQGPGRRAADLLALPGGAVGGADAAPDPTFAILHGLYWLCANLAAEQPLLLLVDDAHWADASSLRFLAFLQPRLDELPVALVVALRPDEEGPAAELLAGLVADAGADVLRPPALSPAAVAHVLAQWLGVEPAPVFAAACHRATGGTPLLVDQLARACRDEGIAPSTDAAPRVEELGARPVARWAQVRLGRLPPDAGALARAVAVLETAELREAGTLADLDPAAAAAAADRLTAAGILDAGRPLAFSHPLVRAGVYGALAQAERSAAHRRAAELLDAGGEQERLAEHLLATEPAGDAWVVERLLAVSRSAAARGAPESTAAYLRRALEEPPPPALRADVLLELGMAEFAAGLATAADRLEAAYESADSGERRILIAAAQSHVLLRELRSGDALAAIERAAASAPPELAGTLEVAAAGVGTIDAATAPRIGARLRALRARADAPDAPRDLLGLAAFAAAESNEPAERAAALARRAFAAGPTRVPEPTELPWWSQSAIALVWTERFAEVLPIFDAAIAHARRAGDSALLSAALAFRAQVALRRGDLRAAESDARTAFATRDLPPPALWHALAAGELIDTLVEQGRLDEAQVLADENGALAEREIQTAAVLRYARGRLALARREPGAALRDLRAARDVLRRTFAPCNACVMGRSDVALALLAAGDEAGAVAEAEAELERARAFGAPGQLGIALTAAGSVRGDEPLLREAVRVLEGSECALELARARVELGALLRRENRRRDAQALLRDALAAARRAAAAPLADTAEQELRATGARPRRVMLSGLESLTASERRVAELAGQGMTNREIAQALFVTTRTVEGHLTQVFAKLGLRSREELPAALAADDAVAA